MTGVFVISGPTAVGKGTVVRELVNRYPQVWVSISATTRTPRPGEQEGIDYFFVSDAEFDRLIATDGLLEWATVHGTTRYGTPKGPVEAAVAAGRTVILEIDVQGALQAKKAYPGAILVFLAPPSTEELLARLRGRGTETAAQIQTRLATMVQEMAAKDRFDHVLVNDSLAETVANLVDLLGLPDSKLL